MANRTVSIVKQRQEPLRERYRSTPDDARITDGARTSGGARDDPFHGTVLPGNGSEVSLRFGIHRAVGGYHDVPNPGDILSAALAACLDSTLRMVANRLGVRLRALAIDVSAECDVRGCLRVDDAVPVGFQRMRCLVAVQSEDEVESAMLDMLLAAAERSCVVLQTLRGGVNVETVRVPGTHGDHIDEVSGAGASAGARG